MRLRVQMSVAFPACMSACMSVCMSVCFFMYMFMTVQIAHVVVVILICILQDDIKVADVKPRFLYSADLRPEASDRQAFQHLFQHFLICSEIKQRSHRHVAADA